jgi:Na+/proline symporter
MAAIPLALVAFGHTGPAALLPSIVVIMIATAAYTLAGGIRAVIWTDVLQAGVYVGAVVAAAVLLMRWIPVGPGELFDILRTTGDSGKLRVIDAAFDPLDRAMLARPFNLWAVLLGLSLLNLAAFGTDQDLVQRMLTCRDAARGGRSLVVSYLLSVPVVALLLLVGLLLHVYYNRPDIMGMAAGGAAVESRDVFVRFIVEKMPPGLRGLMVAGILAAAMSTLSSALNAMSSTTVADFYRRFAPLPPTPRRERAVGRAAVAAWAMVLSAVACLCVWWQQHSGLHLVDFALNVMVFAYSGMIAVFLAAIFTRRGSSASAIAALVTGFAAVLLMQGAAWDLWAPAAWAGVRLAFGWQMLLATTAAFAVCCLGRRPQRNSAA